MIISSSDGTAFAIEKMEKAWHLLHESYLMIQEINNGDYSPLHEAKQFDSVTCPELANWTNNITDISTKIDKYVYQKTKK